MKAVMLHGLGDVRLEDVPEPGPPEPDEVTIKVSRCGICGTDAHEFAHGGPMTPLTRRHPGSGHIGPTVIGHEFTGTVVAVGAHASGFAEGSRVVAGAGRWCGTCAACRAGRTNLCVRYCTYGLNMHGGMTEYINVPAAMCVPVPDHCPDASAVLAQPLAIAMHAVDRSAAAPGTHALVVGAGAIGALLVAAGAHQALSMSVVDVDAARLETATELGAERTELVVDGDQPPPFADVPVVFEASGTAAGLRHALSAVSPGGRVVAVGLPAAPVPVELRAAVVSEVDIVSSSAHVCRQDLPKAIYLLAARRIDEVLVAQVVGMDVLVDGGLAEVAAGGVRGKTIVAM
jgi:(R,R)-butanediol dehydrogenase/meso-butanediol dehydrogenase/diacetyl reductase